VCRHRTVTELAEPAVVPLKYQLRAPAGDLQGALPTVTLDDYRRRRDQVPALVAGVTPEQCLPVLVLCLDTAVTVRFGTVTHWCWVQCCGVGICVGPRDRVADELLAGVSERVLGVVLADELGHEFPEVVVEPTAVLDARPWRSLNATRWSLQTGAPQRLEDVDLRVVRDESEHLVEVAHRVRIARRTYRLSVTELISYHGHT
jgi:hypothetical protein